MPGELYSVEDVDTPGPAGIARARGSRSARERLHPVLFLHGGGLVIDREGYDAPLRSFFWRAALGRVGPSAAWAPEPPFSSAADDALAAARWLNAEAFALSRPRAVRRGQRHSGGNSRRPSRYPRAQARGCASVLPGAHLPDAGRNGEFCVLRRIRRGLWLLKREVALVLRPVSGAQRHGARRRVSPLSSCGLSDVPAALLRDRRYCCATTGKLALRGVSAPRWRDG